MERGLKAHSLHSANFNIPKIKNNEILQKVTLTSRDAQDLIKEVDHSFLDEKYKQSWKLTSVEFVRSPHVEKLYRAKRAELKDEGRPLQEQLCFLAFSQKFLATKIAREGLRVQKRNQNTLGNSGHGVYLWKNIDPQLRFIERGDAFILVFKVTPGRIKPVPPANSEELEPTPNYDCHISSVQPRPTDSLRDQFRRSQIYLYEYTDEAEPSRQPRHCLPYALLQYCHEDLAQKTESSAYSMTKPVPAPASNRDIPPRKLSADDGWSRPVAVESCKVQKPEQSAKDRLSTDVSPRQNIPPTPPRAGVLPHSAGNTHALGGTDTKRDAHPVVSREERSETMDAEHYSDDEELDEQMQSIIRQPHISRINNSLLNVTRDPRLRRQSLETAPKEIPLQQAVKPAREVVHTATGDAGSDGKFSSSVMETMRKTLDRILGRDHPAQQDASEALDHGQISEDPFNSWGLTWKDENRDDEENESRGSLVGPSRVVGASSVQTGSSPRVGSSPRATNKDAVASLDSPLLAMKPAGPVLTESDLAALAGTGGSADQARRETDRQDHFQEPVGFVVLDEYRCSESDEPDSFRSDMGHTSPKAAHKPLCHSGSYSHLSLLGESTLHNSHLHLSTKDVESPLHSDGTSGRPLKSALKKPDVSDSDAVRVKKKLSIGDYKRLKQKKKEETRAAGETQMKQSGIGEGQKCESLNFGRKNSCERSGDSASAANIYQDTTISKSPPSAFGFLQSFTRKSEESVSTASGMEVKQVTSEQQSTSDFGNKNVEKKTETANEMLSVLDAGNSDKGNTKPVISFERLSASLQSAFGNRTPKLSMQKAGSIQRNQGESGKETANNQNDGAYSEAGALGTSHIATDSGNKLKSPILDRLAKMYIPQTDVGHNRSDATLIGQLPEHCPDKVVARDMFQEPGGSDTVVGEAPEDPEECTEGVSQGKEVDDSKNHKVFEMANFRKSGEGSKLEVNTEQSVNKKDDVEIDVKQVDSEGSKVTATSVADEAQVDMEGQQAAVQADRFLGVSSEESVSCRANKTCDAAKANELNADGKANTESGGTDSHCQDKGSVNSALASAEELTTLFRIAKGLRPGPSGRGTSSEAPVQSLTLSSVQPSGENSPDVSKLSGDLSASDAQDDRASLTGSEKSASSSSSRKTAVSRKAHTKSKGRSTDTSPEPVLPVNEEEYEAMVRLAKGLRPGRRIQVDGLGKNPTDDPLPVLEVRGRSKTAKLRAKKVVEQADKVQNSSGETAATSDVEPKEKRQTKRRRKKGSSKKNRKHKAERGQGLSGAPAVHGNLSVQEDADYHDLQPDTPVVHNVSTFGKDSGAEESAIHDVVSVIQENVEMERSSESAGTFRALPSMEKFEAQPITALGIRHWMEALSLESLNPDVVLVDLVQAYLRGADYDNCSICQKVIDMTFVENTPDEDTEIAEKAEEDYDGGEVMENMQKSSETVDETLSHEQINCTPAEEIPVGNAECGNKRLNGDSHDTYPVSEGSSHPEAAVLVSAASKQDATKDIEIRESIDVVLQKTSVESCGEIQEKLGSGLLTYTGDPFTSEEPDSETMTPKITANEDKTGKEYPSCHNTTSTSAVSESDQEVAQTDAEVSPCGDSRMTKQSQTAHDKKDTVEDVHLSSKPEAVRESPKSTDSVTAVELGNEKWLPPPTFGSCTAESPDDHASDEKASSEPACVKDKDKGYPDLTGQNDDVAPVPVSEASQCGNQTGPKTALCDKTTQDFDLHAFSSRPVESFDADDIWSTGFWKHPNEIVTPQEVAPQNVDGKHNRSSGASFPGLRLQRRAHSADEAKSRVVPELSKASQVLQSQSTSIRQLNSLRERKEVSVDKQQTTSTQFQSSTKSCWQQWKSEQAAKRTGNDFDKGPENYETSGRAEGFQDHDYRKGREGSPVFSAPSSAIVRSACSDYPNRSPTVSHCVDDNSLVRSMFYNRPQAAPGLSSDSTPLVTVPLPAAPATDARNTHHFDPSVANELLDHDYRRGRDRVTLNSMSSGPFLASVTQAGSVPSCQPIPVGARTSAPAPLSQHMPHQPNPLQASSATFDPSADFSRSEQLNGIGQMPASHVPSSPVQPVLPPASHVQNSPVQPVLPPASHVQSSPVQPVLPPASHVQSSSVQPVLPPASHVQSSSAQPFLSPASHVQSSSVRPVLPRIQEPKPLTSGLVESSASPTTSSDASSILDLVNKVLSDPTIASLCRGVRSDTSTGLFSPLTAETSSGKEKPKSLDSSTSVCSLQSTSSDITQNLSHSLDSSVSLSSLNAAKLDTAPFDIVVKETNNKKAIPGLDLVEEPSPVCEPAEVQSQRDVDTKEAQKEENQWSDCAQTFLHKFQHMTKGVGTSLASSEEHGKTAAAPPSAEVVAELKKKYAAQSESKSPSLDNLLEPAGGDCTAGSRTELKTPEEKSEDEMDICDSDSDVEDSVRSTTVKELHLNASSSLDISGTHGDESPATSRHVRRSVALNCKTLCLKPVSSKTQLEQSEHDEEAVSADKNQSSLKGGAHAIPSRLSVRDVNKKRTARDDDSSGGTSLVTVKCTRQDCSMQSSSVSNESEHSASETSENHGKKNAYDWFSDILEGKEKVPDAAEPEPEKKKPRLENAEIPQTSETSTDTASGDSTNAGHTLLTGVTAQAVTQTVLQQQPYSSVFVGPTFSLPLHAGGLYPLQSTVAAYQGAPVFTGGAQFSSMSQFPSDVMSAPYFTSVPSPVILPPSIPHTPPVPPPTAVSPVDRFTRFPLNLVFPQQPPPPGVGVHVTASVAPVPVGIVSPMVQGLPPPGVSTVRPSSSPAVSYSTQSAATSASTRSLPSTIVSASAQPEPPGTDECRAVQDISGDEARKDTDCKSRPETKDLLYWFSDKLDGKREATSESDEGPELKKFRHEKDTSTKPKTEADKLSERRSKTCRDESALCVKPDASNYRGERQSLNSSRKNICFINGKPKISFKVSGISKPRRQILKSSVCWTSDSDDSALDEDSSESRMLRTGRRSTEGSHSKDRSPPDSRVTSSVKTSTHRSPRSRQRYPTQTDSPRKGRITAFWPEGSRDTRSSSDKKGSSSRKESGRSYRDRHERVKEKDGVKEKPSTSKSKHCTASLEPGSKGKAVSAKLGDRLDVKSKDTHSKNDDERALDDFAHALLEDTVGDVAVKTRSSNIATLVMTSLSASAESMQSAHQKGTSAHKNEGVSKIDSILKSSQEKDAGLGTVNTSDNSNLADEDLEYLASEKERILKEMEALWGDSQSEGEDSRGSASPALSLLASKQDRPAVGGKDGSRSHDVLCTDSENLSQRCRNGKDKGSCLGKEDCMSSDVLFSVPEELVIRVPSVETDSDERIVVPKTDERRVLVETNSVTLVSTPDTRSVVSTTDTNSMVSAPDTEVVSTTDTDSLAVEKDTRTVESASDTKCVVSASYSDSPVTEEEMSAFKRLLFKSAGVESPSVNSCGSFSSHKLLSYNTAAKEVSPSLAESDSKQSSSSIPYPQPQAGVLADSCSVVDSGEKNNQSGCEGNASGLKDQKPCCRARKSSGGQAWSDYLLSGKANNKEEVLGLRKPHLGRSICDQRWVAKSACLEKDIHMTDDSNKNSDGRDIFVKTDIFSDADKEWSVEHLRKVGDQQSSWILMTKQYENKGQVSQQLKQQQQQPKQSVLFPEPSASSKQSQHDKQQQMQQNAQAKEQSKQDSDLQQHIEQTKSHQQSQPSQQQMLQTKQPEQSTEHSERVQSQSELHSARQTEQMQSQPKAPSTQQMEQVQSQPESLGAPRKEELQSRPEAHSTQKTKQVQSQTEAHSTQKKVQVQSQETEQVRSQPEKHSSQKTEQVQSRPEAHTTQLTEQFQSQPEAHSTWQKEPVQSRSEVHSTKQTEQVQSSTWQTDKVHSKPEVHRSQKQSGGSQSASTGGGGGYTLRDFIVDKFQVQNPETIAPYLPYKLTMEMSKLSSKQRSRLRMQVKQCLDQQVHETEQVQLPLLESFQVDQIQIELGLVQECLNLLEAIQTVPGKTGNTWDTGRINMSSGAHGSGQGMQFIQQTYLAQSMYSKVRDALLAVLADFTTAVKDAETNAKGRIHQRISDEILLPCEKGKLYSQEGCSLILLTAIPPSAFRRLVQVKEDIEASLKRRRTLNPFAARQETERTDKLHAMRANLLITFCGRINHQRLTRLEMAVNRYNICEDHLQRVLGEESVAKMTFFQAMFTAIRNHRRDVAREVSGPPRRGR